VALAPGPRRRAVALRPSPLHSRSVARLSACSSKEKSGGKDRLRPSCPTGFAGVVTDFTSNPLKNPSRAEGFLCAGVPKSSSLCGRWQCQQMETSTHSSPCIGAAVADWKLCFQRVQSFQIARTTLTCPYSGYGSSQSIKLRRVRPGKLPTTLPDNIWWKCDTSRLICRRNSSATAPAAMTAPSW
jgi:hypothetical protein